ncbi:hypothetical protein GCM10023196_079910 [Actinoallomurus vinaceus]|uniref:DDE Tnp4 domain-containing protein n=1 Tax=Actinoallomurus vinaceus TaxID=1080074 RepID=A0ABP8UM57_9ACTN
MYPAVRGVASECRSRGPPRRPRPLPHARATRRPARTLGPWQAPDIHSITRPISLGAFEDAPPPGNRPLLRRHALIGGVAESRTALLPAEPTPEERPATSEGRLWEALHDAPDSQKGFGVISETLSDLLSHWVGDTEHDLRAAQIWGILRALATAGLIVLADKGYTGAGQRIATPYKGRGKPESQKAANRSHACLRGPGERANAQLKSWKILTQLRCCPHRAGHLAKAIHVLQTRQANSWLVRSPCS